MTAHLPRRASDPQGTTRRGLLAVAATLAGTLGSLALAAGAPAHPPPAADTLAQIRQRGVLVVGVKRDVPLWGQWQPASGRIEGLEPDLAADLARRLGVRLEMVGVLSAERLPALEQRRVDVILATLSDTPERRTRVTLVQPHYYASGANLLARRSAGFRDWADLRHRRICGRRGAFYNRALTLSSGMDLVALYDNGVAISALREGRCEGLLYEDISIVAMLRDDRWGRDFEMALPTVFVTPWSIGLHRDEAGGPLERAVAEAVADWHRQGLITALERRWGIPVSAYARRMQAAWQQTGPTGPRCQLPLSDRTPADCL